MGALVAGFSLRSVLTVAGIIVPFVIAAFLFNSTKERNEEILEAQRSVRNSDAIAELQAKQNAIEASVIELTAQLQEIETNHNRLSVDVEKLHSAGHPNRDVNRLLNDILEQLVEQDDQIEELRQRTDASSLGPQELEALVIETIQRLLRTDR